MNVVELMHNGLTQSDVDLSNVVLGQCLTQNNGNWDALGRCQYLAGRAAQTADDVEYLHTQHLVELSMAVVILILLLILGFLAWKKLFGRGLMSRRYTRLVVKHG